jgi:leucyl-tRNA synthetase
MKFNTAIATMMALVNDFLNAGSVTRGELKTLLLLLNPGAPHITEEMWENCGFPGMLNQQSWPSWDESKTLEDTVEIVVQINGRPRAVVTVERGAGQEEVKELVMQEAAVQRHLSGKTVLRELLVEDRVYSIVAK